jgi:hypothetical protein
MQPHQLHIRPGVKSRKYRKLNPSVPCALDVVLFLPYGVGSVIDYERFPLQVQAEPRLDIRKIIMSIEVERPPQLSPEEQAAETERVLSLPPAGRRAWHAELQRKMDAFDLYAKGGAQ